MKICIYAEPLHTLTSANPFRGMLRSLLKLRHSDSFVFVVRKGSENSPQIKNFLASCDSENWKLVVDSRTRKEANLLALLGQENYCAITEDADVYLNMDIDYLGPRANPLITTVADLSFIRYPKHSSLKWHGIQMRRHALRTMARHASHIIAISDFTKQDIEQYDSSLKGRITVVHCGIDNDWWHCECLEKGMSQNEFNFTRSYWIWWGQITKRKNVDGLVRAYAKLLTTVADKRLVPDLILIGNLGFDSLNFPNLILSPHVSNRIKLLPFQPLPKLIKLVKESCGLLFPSYYEGFGMPVIETMSQGKPVLISNRSALPEVAGGLGVVRNPEDIDDLCDGMLNLLKNEQHSSSASAARKQWAANFTHEVAAQKYSRVITSLTSIN